MKNVIVTIAEILLGVVLFMLIVGSSTGSLKSEAQSIFNNVVTEMRTVR
jgi:hypothetical protein